MRGARGPRIASRLVSVAGLVLVLSAVGGGSEAAGSRSGDGGSMLANRNTRWMGEGPLKVRPFEGSETAEYSFSLSGSPRAGASTTIIVRSTRGHMSRDAWLYGWLWPECPSQAQDDCPHDTVKQLGSSNPSGFLSAPYEPGAGALVFEVYLPGAGSYKGSMRILDGGRLLATRVRLEADGASELPHEERLPLSVIGRTVPVKGKTGPPPAWLRPAAYVLLAILALGGICLAATTPKRMARTR